MEDFIVVFEPNFYKKKDIGHWFFETKKNIGYRQDKKGVIKLYQC